MSPTADVLPTRERHRLDTRERIFDAAAEEIRREGLAGTSVSRIARASGVSRQTFYDHFPTLESVVAEAFSRYRVRVVEHLGARVEPGAELQSLLHALVDAFFAAMDPDNARLRQEIGAYLLRGSEAGTLIDEPLFLLVGESVAGAQSTSRIRTDLAASDVARLVLTCLAGFLLIESEAPEARAERARTAVDVLLAGLRP